LKQDEQYLPVAHDNRYGISVFFGYSCRYFSRQVGGFGWGRAGEKGPSGL